MPVFIIASIIAAFATAVSNGYLQGRPLPYFSSSCNSASGNGWGLANKGTSSASKGTSSAGLTGSRSSTGSYRSGR